MRKHKKIAICDLNVLEPSTTTQTSKIKQESGDCSRSLSFFLRLSLGWMRPGRRRRVETVSSSDDAA